MHYTKNYAGLVGKAKRERAINDCKDYLGPQMYTEKSMILADMMGSTPTKKTIRQTINAVEAFLGIRGYPARAMVFHALRRRVTK